MSKPVSDPVSGAVRQPPLILTTGEPAGIGPDLCLQLASARLPTDGAPWLLAGCPATLGARAASLGLDLQLQLATPTTAQHVPAKVVQCWPFPVAVPVIPGQLEARNAPAVLSSLRATALAVAAGDACAMVTAPVQKSIIAAAGLAFTALAVAAGGGNDRFLHRCSDHGAGVAGLAFTGHTEFLADLFSQPDAPCCVVMLLVAGNLRVALATTHLPLRAVPDAITTADLLRTLQILQRDLQQRFCIAAPRIAVLGLNPHAGEAGHLGHEEATIIAPAIAAAQAAGIRAFGPLPADTAFTPQALLKADAVLAMYHDQGLPVLKYVGFGAGVNVTLGLPIIRTSVDHGTALDLAGTGRADAGSLRAAIALATELVGVARAA
jgi:4-hydroxythreonine-4-phosphate dehydrogenase